MTAPLRIRLVPVYRLGDEEPFLWLPLPEADEEAIEMTRALERLVSDVEEGA